MSLEALVQNGARWDGDTYSIKYFNVSKNFTLLKRGKNTITLAPDTTILPNSRIQIELVDKSGNQIPIEYPNQITPNGDIILHITIGDDIPSGAAKLIITGTAVVDVDTGRQLNTSGFNIVWRGLTEIKRLDDSDTPKDPDDIVFQNDFKEIKVAVRPIDFSYRDKTTDRPTTDTGTGILTYLPVLESSTFSQNVANKPTTRTKETSRPLSSVDNQISSTSIGNPISNTEGYPTIQSTVAEFTPDMVGGVITITPNITTVVPPNLQQFIGTVPQFTANIIEVLNDKNIKVDTHFYYTVENPQTPFVADSFTATTYTIDYNSDVPTTQGQKVTGYAQMCFDNVATSNGKVDKVRVSAKPVGSIGGPMLLGDYDVITPNKMEDTSNYSFDPKKGLGYKNVGDVTSNTDVTTYYDYAEYAVNTTKASTLDNLIYDDATPSISPPSHTSTNISNAIQIQAPLDTNKVSAISVKDQYLGSAKKDTEYKISLNAYSQKDSTGKTPLAKLFIEGPSITEGGDTSNKFGTFIDSISGQDGSLQNGLEFTFTALTDSPTIKLHLVMEVGVWEFSNIKLEPTSTTNNSPNEFCVLVPLDNLPVNKIDEEYVFVIDFIGENGNPTNLNLTTQSITLNSNTTLDEILILNTLNNSTLIQNKISGSFTSISASFSNTITNLSSSIAGDITNISSSLASEINNISGSLIYSGSSFESPDFIRLFRTNNTFIDVKLKLGSGAYGDNDVLDYINSIGVRSGSDADTDTITTVGTSSLGSSGTITLVGSGSIDISEIKTVSGSIITIFSDANPRNISGSIVSMSYNPITGILRLDRQYTSSLQTTIDTYDNWIISDGTTSSNINNGNTLTITGCGVSLSGQTLTISSTTPSDCTITLQGDNVGICPTIGDFTLNQNSNETLTICHKDTSTLTGAYGTNGISSITVDGLGHVTAISTATYCTSVPTVNNSTITISAGTGLSGGGSFTLNQASNCTITLTNSITNTDVDVSVSNLVTRLSQIGCTTYTIGSGTGVTACFSGNVCTSRCMTADNFITTSDVRLKSDLKEIKDSIKVLKQFSSYCYMKNGYEDAGFIAQEVCTAIPFSVNENAEGYLTMRDRPILAYLHSAIIDINNRLENIEQNLYK
jgi:hypothetical protein